MDNFIKCKFNVYVFCGKRCEYFTDFSDGYQDDAISKATKMAHGIAVAYVERETVVDGKKLFDIIAVFEKNKRMA